MAAIDRRPGSEQGKAGAVRLRNWRDQEADGLWASLFVVVAVEIAFMLALIFAVALFLD